MLIRRLRYWMKSARRSEALREEMELHLAEKAAELEADGLTTEHARAEARRRFGNVGLKHEESREIWISRFASELGQDVRYGVRMMVKKPTVTIVAVLTLALGVGANTAIFSIVDAVLLRSLPYRDPDRLVRIFFNEPGVGLRDVRFSKPELDDLQTRADVFEDVTPIFEGSENVTGAGQPERVDGVNGSFSYFSMLGVTPQFGRLFGPQDFVPGFAEKVVISDGLWRRAYGADPNVVGRILRLDNDPQTIIGVLPPGFRHPGPTVSGDAEVFGAFGATGAPFPKPARGTRILGQWNRTTEAWPDTGASAGAAHGHGCPITPRLSRRLPAAGAMDH